MGKSITKEEIQKAEMHSVIVEAKIRMCSI